MTRGTVLTVTKGGKMADRHDYIASAGQTHIPFQENEGVPFVEYEKPAMPEPPASVSAKAKAALA